MTDLHAGLARVAWEMCKIVQRMLNWFSEFDETVHAFRVELAQRPQLNDADFFSRYFGATGIPKAIPIRLRQSLEATLGLDLGGLQPSDNLALIFDYVDFADILKWVGKDLNMNLPLPTVVKAPLSHKGSSSPNGEIDGTFGSLVAYIARLKARSPI